MTRTLSPLTVVPREDARHLNKAFRRLGYLHVPDLGVSDDDLADVRHMLDSLFDQYDDLPRSIAHERALNSDQTTVRVPEIIRCTLLEPRLLQTPVYRAISALASSLLGGEARMVFDHALYKPPGLSAPTPWHQDAAYGRHTGLAIWLPLQATGVEDGCMRYVPFSHRDRNRPHLLETTPEGKQIWYLDEESVEKLNPISLPVPLGAVTVHHRRMIHGAWPNVGTSLRRAWITVFIGPPGHRQRLIRRLRRRPAQYAADFDSPLTAER